MVAYKMYVGINYDTNEKLIECNPEDVVSIVTIMQNLLLDEKDAKKFLFNIEVVEGELNGTANMVGRDKSG